MAVPDVRAAVQRPLLAVAQRVGEEGFQVGDRDDDCEADRPKRGACPWPVWIRSRSRIVSLKPMPCRMDSNGRAAVMTLSTG